MIEHSDLSLYCRAHGYERPTISWSFSGGDLSNTNGVTIREGPFSADVSTSTLTLTNISRSSAGLYQCIANNTFNTTIAGADIAVNCKL